MLTASLRAALLIATSVAFSACGTTFNLPAVSGASVSDATRMFQEERQGEAGQARPSPNQAARNFVQVASRIEPIAERFCEEQTSDVPNFNCDVQIVIDDQMPVRNAYQTYARDGTPIVAFTLPMVADARNQDEIAFVLGHEFGHHIAQHIQKGQQQATAGALILGALMVAAQAQSAGSPYYNQVQAQQDLQNVMELGYAAGQRAFSQEYELEADLIGTYIAEAAGYDAVRGARFFARPEPTRREDGALSFWGTHPPNEARLALVIETARALRTGQALQRRP